jgi:hypothetical protein
MIVDLSENIINLSYYPENETFGRLYIILLTCFMISHQRGHYSRIAISITSNNGVLP